MSLINQMLKDLESRNLKDAYDEQKMLRGVQSQDSRQPNRNMAGLIIVVLVIITLLMMGAWFLFKPEKQVGDSIETATISPSSVESTPKSNVSIEGLVALAAGRGDEGVVLELNLAKPAQGILLRQQDNKARVELRGVSYEDDLSVPVSVTELFPGLKLEKNNQNTVLTISLASNESLKLRDETTSNGQSVFLTKVIIASIEPELVRNVDAKPPVPVEKASAENTTVPERKEPAKPASDDSPLPVVKKAVPLSPEQQALRDYQQAQKLLARGDDSAALESLRKSIGLYPLPQSYVALSGLLIEQRNNTEARRLLENGIKALPGNADMAFLLARLQLDAGLPEQSRSTLINALANGRADADYLALLAAVSQQLKRYTESSQAYVEALKIKPGQSNWWMGLGLSLEEQEKYSQAIEAYYKALSSGLADQYQGFVLSRIQLLEGDQE